MSPKYLLPTREDNVAIVTRRLEAGEFVEIGEDSVPISSVILQGHRMCVHPIRKGESLLSWGLPFGTAIDDITPGEYICNEKARDVLMMRNADDYDESLKVNFVDRDTVAERILPSLPEFGHNSVDIHDGLTFNGFYRGEIRGWGTRNYIAIIGVTSRSRGLVLKSVERMQELFPAKENFDGVVPVVHTEGGGKDKPNNLRLLLRTLAGFATNPNVGAAILVNDEESTISNADLQAELASSCLTSAEYCIEYYEAKGGAEDKDIDRLVSIADSLAPQVFEARRAPAPLSGLRLGLQCGGSDAFSGVSANQVLGKAVHQLIRRGGTANLAETDELIGAEQYVLQKVADEKAFNAFLSIQQRFKDHAEAHGHTAEGNVSGGNLYRGLYNITLKSLGAARKKDPTTYIDYVIDYGAPMIEPGYYFMDSPGNDLESIAGQVASGANLILFSTGNGSITNFPFVPTLKIVTTNERFSLLESDMDFNAGRVLDGESLDQAGCSLFDLFIDTASGQRSKGENTGQYQTQIWRESFLTAENEQPLKIVGIEKKFSGLPLLHIDNKGREKTARSSYKRSSLILPTSLCSGQVAEQIAKRVNESSQKCHSDLQVVALPHTEGCGVSGGNAEDIFRDTLIGYATHPLISSCVFLEHGCEKTHNNYFQSALSKKGIDPNDFSWASIQLEGGINAVSQHVESALRQSPQGHRSSRTPPVQIGLATSAGVVGPDSGRLLGNLVQHMLSRGVGVVIAANDPLLSSQEFSLALRVDNMPTTLNYSQQPKEAGLHIMDCSSSDWLEVATGLGATGCQCLITTPMHRPLQPHRFIPTLQISLNKMNAELDYCGSNDDSKQIERICDLVDSTLSGVYQPKHKPSMNVGFQISRGRCGVSL